jgi:hypothetical protein
MHQTDHVNHHFFNTIINNDECARWLITVILNPEKIIHSDVKCRSLWCIYEWDLSMVNISRHWVIVCSIVGTPFEEGIQILCQEQSDKEYSSWCKFNGNDYFKGRAWVFPKDLLKLICTRWDGISEGTKGYLCNSIRLSRKRYSKQNNSVWNLVQLWNDSMEG